MGLTTRSVGLHAAKNDLMLKIPKGAKVIALAGNPNVGKSTLFNRITGMNQHTGNWPGKTVTNAVGEYKDNENHFAFVDIPGTYSLMAHSAEEEVARDFLVFGRPDAVVVVCDATCLERNLNLVLQTMEICKNVIVCVNLLDEAAKKGMIIDIKSLSAKLGVPVVGTSARQGKGVNKLISAIAETLKNIEMKNFFRVTYPTHVERAINTVEEKTKKIFKKYNIDQRWAAIKLIENDKALIKALSKHVEFELLLDTNINNALVNAKMILADGGISESSFKDYLVSGLVLAAEEICDEKVVQFTKPHYRERYLKRDRFLTGKITGPLVMIALLGVVFWLTIVGANYPSALLWQGFSFIEGKLFTFAEIISMPKFLSDMLFGGIYRVVAWVVSVMLPPMAIFFPFFTLLEDSGYLPRIAFNLDKGFKKCSACGKQALTMCMGFGCNAAGITGCRIIDSPRERLIAIITNNFVPCNGRFPMLIAIITMFFVVGNTVFSSVIATSMLIFVILLGIGATFVVSKLLSVTLLKGQPSSFTLELPPYRKPQIGSVIVRSIFDRSLFVLGRALAVAAPAGLLIWLMANVMLDGATLLEHCSDFLDPLGRLMGMDGVILLGFILGFPANEIVIPIILMVYMSNGMLVDYESLSELKILLIDNGWNFTTAICTMLFSLMHWPCSTAILTAKKETGSIYWTFITFAVPTIIGVLLCMMVNFLFSIF